ncbi:PQQ-dependent sugar dehydrogenase [Vibrio penaeicida]|uniref:PQQ-dependent sugar dehydrogenase n=1 Tax=Vibrio penaeicida TaxID=104609 RepID=UPI002735F683|nr:PQQ-dependent sugar dehydrogenase [Vibrio penaeicida]MDP2571554.1 PQQ-dependent sugar dehydrogenase [Vibrio penaeicida]
MFKKAILFKKAIWVSIATFALVSQALADQATYTLNKIAKVKGAPWGLTFVDDGLAFVTTREGSAYLLDVRTGDLARVSGLPDVYARGQGGLMDVAIPPQSFASSNPTATNKNGKQLYFTYSKPAKGGSATALATAKLVGATLKDWKDLIVTQSITDTSRHYGSRIAFDDNEHLFFSIGDRGERSNGQDLTTHAGSILRLTLDGAQPASNPDLGGQALPETWSYGHRNPQGLFFDKQSQQLWSVEHGPRGGDEINLILKGKNYGWPITSHGKEYWGPISVGESEEKAGIEPPKKVYVPSIAPSSLVLYRGKHYPELNGKILIGALKLTHINVVDPQSFDETRLFADLGERIRSIAISPSEHLYFGTDNGNIFQISTAKME